MLTNILGNKKLIADIVLVGSLLLIGLSVLLFMSLTREEGAVAVVTVDGAGFRL